VVFVSYVANNDDNLSVDLLSVSFGFKKYFIYIHLFYYYILFYISYYILYIILLLLLYIYFIYI